MIIMSNNQWKQDDNLDLWRELGEDCSAEARVPGMFRAYKEIMPDFLGLQEVSVHMGRVLMDLITEDPEMAGYEYITGGDTPIVYRADKYKLLESGFFRYPEEVPGLEGSFNNNETKSYCWGIFEDRTDGSKLAFLSTHLWFRSSAQQAGSAQAREYQMRLAMKKMDRLMAKYACPGIIVGDLNCAMGSRCLNAMYENGWYDVYDVTAGNRDETSGYHTCGRNGWAPIDKTLDHGWAIDHIMAKNFDGYEFTKMGRITADWFEKISDHYPVYTEVVRK